MHGFIPDAFCEGITVPVIKDRLGDQSCTSNYRPITVISEVFEYCINMSTCFILNHFSLGLKRI